MCASRGCSSRLAHIAKSAMYAPPQTGRRCSVSAGSRERSRNVPWNQWLHKVRTYRGLCGRTRGGALHVCIQGLLITSRTHRKKREVCATPDWEEGFRLCRISGSKPECALDAMASQSAHLSRIVWAHSWRCLPCVRPEAAHRVSHTSQKARCMRHPSREEDGSAPADFRERSRNVPWNQRLHKVCTYRGLGGAHVAVLANMRPEAARRVSHTSQKARCNAPPQPGRMGSVSADFRERSRNVPWNQRFHKVCAYRGLGGAHVAVLAMCASWGLLIAARRSAMRAVGRRSAPGLRVVFLS